MNKILTGWNFMRLLRLCMGVAIVVQGIMVKDPLFALMGGLFVIMPLLNIGCCASSGCGIRNGVVKQDAQEVAYEEVH
jgi:hypothetical protein